MAKLLSGSRIYGNAVVDATLTSGNLAANSNVASTSTTTGALRVTGGAGISGNVFAGNVLATGFFYANGTPFTSSSYGNATVATYIPTDPTFTGYLTFANANAATQATSLNTINANLGAYQTYGNVTFSTQSNAASQQTQIDTSTTGLATINANLGAYQTYANANVSTQATSINTINANLGAYQTFANANVSNLYNSILGSNSAIVTANTAMKSYVDTSLSTLTNGASTALDTLLEIGTALGNNANFSGVMVTWLGNITANNTAANTNISTTQANLGAYQTFANANLATQTTSINTINANLGAYQTFANANAASQATAITSLATSANANVVAYLSSGSVATNIITTANITASNITTSGTSGNILNVDYIFSNNFVYSANGIGILSSVNANIGTLHLGNISTNANLGAYQTYGNAQLALRAPIASPSFTGVLTSAGNIVAASGTASASTTTGALVVAGGAGISGAVNIGTSLTVDGGVYGNVVTTQFGSVFATAYGPNGYSIIQAWSSTTGGALGFNAYGNIVYSSGAINFKTGATIRDKDYPTGGTTGVQIAANGAIIAQSAISSTTTGTGAVIVTGGVGISGAVYTGGNVTVTGHVLPSANVTYDLGSPTQRWKDLYLSGNTMVLGQANIQSHSSGITIYAPNQTVNLNQNLHTTATPSFANVTATGNLIVNARLRDYNGNAGLNGQLLVSTGSGIQWQTIQTGSLASLTDVNLSSPQVQQVLTYDGTNWVNADSNATVASAVFASSQSDLGYVTDLVLNITEDEGSVTDVSNNIYDLGVLSFTGIISLNNIDQSVKSDYLGYSIIFGF